MAGWNLPISSFVFRSCLKDFVKLPLEWQQKEESPKDWIPNEAQHRKQSTVPEKTGTKIYLSFLKAFTMKHSAAASSFTPSNGLRIEGFN